MIADHVKDLTKDNVLRFYDKYIATNAPCRRKLCVQVVAKQHEEEEAIVSEKEDDEQRGVAEEENVEGVATTKTQEAAGSAGSGTDISPTTTPATNVNNNFNINRTVIKDATEFKRSMPLFPMPATVIVDVVDFGIQKQ